MTYTVHEIFLTMQGEGANMGRVAVFIRFAGCNLWTGREEDRATAACKFCDTEFRGGRKLSASAIVKEAVGLWPMGRSGRFAVLTGGEPCLQADELLVAGLRGAGFRVAIETNGTVRPLSDFDWTCVSPKEGTKLAIKWADELKLVYPQPGAMPDAFASFEARERWLSPMDGPALAENTAAAAAYCLAHPEWRLNIQAHKTWGVR